MTEQKQYNTKLGMPCRRSIRLKNYDYSQNGVYFITMCINNRVCLLGNILEEKMILNNAGEIIEKWWLELKNKFPHIILDEYMIMPNHFHGIIILNNNNNIKNTSVNFPAVGTMVQWFKTMSTNNFIKEIKAGKLKPFHTRLWQRNYYEYIIRNEEDFNHIRNYVIYNPVTWKKDKLYMI